MKLSLGETGWATLDELRSCALPDELMAELEVGGALADRGLARRRPARVVLLCGQSDRDPVGCIHRHARGLSASGTRRAQRCSDECPPALIGPTPGLAGAREQPGFVASRRPARLHALRRACDARGAGRSRGLNAVRLRRLKAFATTRWSPHTRRATPCLAPREIPTTVRLPAPRVGPVSATSRLTPTLALPWASSTTHSTGPFMSRSTALC